LLPCFWKNSFTKGSQISHAFSISLLALSISLEALYKAFASFVRPLLESASASFLSFFANSSKKRAKES